DIGGETVGLITYMRTDGVQMAREAIMGIRDHVKSAFGPDYLPVAPREYSSKAKNAQEAHEAVRPTDVSRTPQQVARYLNPDQRRLYDLVWKRAVASQMQSAEMDQTAVDLDDAAGKARLRATGQVIAFDGYLKLYREDIDDSRLAADDENRTLPPMREGEEPKRGEVTANQHFTQPPPRYSEASLVKKMEELGIGRPSTYASILQTLQDREYVRIEQRRFIPEDRGRLVTAFLVSFFERYVDTNFTAALEEKLDDISGGRAEWREVMREFWNHFREAVDATKDLKISDVIDALDEDLGPHFFPANEGGTDPRLCPNCQAGRLGLRLGRTGAFIGCSNYPECRYTRPLAVPGAEGEEAANDGPRSLGTDPATGQEVSVRRGPYGLYTQLGEPGTDEKGKPTKPRRASLPRGMDPDTLTLERALALLNMPRVIGMHPETGEEITANLGRFGPYLKMGALSQSIQPGDDILSIGMNRAMELLANAKPRGITLGNHPKDGAPVEVKRGRFGPFAQHGNTVASLPRGVQMEDFTLDQAVALLAEKGKVLAPKKGAAGRKAPAKKAASPAAEAAPRAAEAAPRKAPARAAKPAAKAPAKKPAAKKAPAKAAAKPATRTKRSG
ncbi:MAG TPA: DNA topoisomerase, partial [Roseomonas sp.]